MITIETKNEFQQFKKLYNKAIKENKDQFIFKNQIVLTSYAKYMIEYVNIKIYIINHE